MQAQPYRWAGSRFRTAAPALDSGAMYRVWDPLALDGASHRTGTAAPA